MIVCGHTKRDRCTPPSTNPVLAHDLFGVEVSCQIRTQNPNAVRTEIATPVGQFSAFLSRFTEVLYSQYM